MRVLGRWVGVALVLPVALAQGNGPFPAGVLEAKSVVILNETHTGTVEDGANEALKQWGHWKVTDDLDAADVVLSFRKKSERTTSGSTKPDDTGSSASYGVTFSTDATITMTATAKGGFAPFYTTETKDAKQKAGRECVQAFIGAWQDEKKRVAGR